MANIKYEMSTPTDDTVELQVLDYIGAWGVEFSQVVQDLMPHKGKALNVIINSGGGSVFEGVAIYNFLKSNFSSVRTEVVGYAASIASIIFLAGTERVMRQGTLLFLHKPWTVAAGNASDLEKEIEALNVIEGELISIYKSNSTLSEEDIRAKLEAETWVDSQDAMDFGFATQIDDTSVDVAASIPQEFMAKYPIPSIAKAAVEIAPSVELEPTATNSIDPKPIAQDDTRENKENLMENTSIVSASTEVNIQNSVDVVKPAFAPKPLASMTGKEFLNVLTTASGPVTKEIGDLLLAVAEANPLRQKALDIRIAGDMAFAWSQGVGGGWGTEGAAIAETVVTLNPVTFGAWTLQGRYDVSEAALEDNASALYNGLKSNIATWFGDQEALVMYGTSNGSAGPQGLFYWDAVNGVKYDTAATGAFTLNDITGFLTTMETKFANLELVMSPSVFNAILALTDASTVSKLRIDFDKKTINGFPYNLHSYAPAYAVTTGAPLILAADLGKYYGIAQRGGSQPIKFAEREAPDAFARRMLYAERVDAKIINPKAGKLFRVK